MHHVHLENFDMNVLTRPMHPAILGPTASSAAFWPFVLGVHEILFHGALQRHIGQWCSRVAMAGSLLQVSNSVSSLSSSSLRGSPYAQAHAIGSS